MRQNSLCSLDASLLIAGDFTHKEVSGTERNKAKHVDDRYLRQLG